jgi:Trk-type K+ transport system membrane component
MLIAFITPYDILGRVSPDIFRILSFLFVFKSLAGIALYYCFWQGKNFNEAIWNSKYYN